MEVITIKGTRETAVKKVAAYVRVSTLEEEQSFSYENQKDYYEKLIRAMPQWELAGIYADRGISGTTKNRPEFQRMLADARAGLIDIIVVKSISRFARNAVDAQNVIHDLTAMDVEVYFDEQRISSFNQNTEMLLNMMATVAEHESRSISQNTRWALQKQAQNGIRKLGNRTFGYKEVDGVLTPDENAWAVKMIFEEFAKGTLPGEIVELLKEKGVKTQMGKDTFCVDAIYYILRNEIYKGDRLIQKAPRKDPISKLVEDGGAYDSYYVEDDHEAIVSKELWDRVQKIYDSGFHKGKRRNAHFLHGLVKCAACGANYRRLKSGRPKGKSIMWTCTNRKDKSICKNPNIKEDDILAGVEKALGEKPSRENCRIIERILVTENRNLIVELRD